MKTIRLFKKDVYLRSATACITSVTQKNGKTLITLDQTIFFPTGGGQSCDTGFLNDVEVTDVYEYEDDIFHQVECPPEALTAGAPVTLTLNWERRFDNMQRHCGEHILSGIFDRLYGGVNRGFHMGEQYMTIDISLEKDPRFTAINEEMLHKAELAANQVIWSNLPVTVRHFDTCDEASGLPLRKPLTLEKDISIVCVGSPGNPSDCVACCGTHPSTAGQVGIIKIYKAESNKGMFRIYFEAGRRAFEKYQAQYGIITYLENALSAGNNDLIDKYKTQQEKNREVRTQLHLIKKEIVAQEAEAIKAMLLTEPGSLPLRTYSLLTTDDIAAISRELSSVSMKLAFLVHRPTMTVFLCSDGNIDCGRLVRENAAIYNGKGGGSKTLARAIFSKEEYIETFIDLIEKHLR